MCIRSDMYNIDRLIIYLQDKTTFNPITQFVFKDLNLGFMSLWPKLASTSAEQGLH